MGVNAIGAIGRGDEDKSALPLNGLQRKKPWEDIGGALNGFGSFVSNLPNNFNSAFTVGRQGGTNTEGAFGA